MSSFKSENKKQLDELRKIEKKIKELQEIEKLEKKPVLITNRILLKFWFFGLLVVFLGYLVFQSLDVLYLILAAYIVSIAMESVIDWFEKFRLGKKISITITYILLAIFLLWWFVYIVPFLFSQFADIFNVLLVKINAFQSVLQTEWLTPVLKQYLPNFIQKEIFHNFTDPSIVSDLEIKIQTSMTNVLNTRSDYTEAIGNMAVNFVTWFATFLTKSAIVITLSILFSIEKQSVMKFIASRWGQRRYKYLYMKLEKIYKKLGIWLKSRMILSVYVGITMYLALWIMSTFGLDIPNKLSLAIILWLLDIIPYIGPTLGWIPAVLLGFMGFGIWWAAIVMVVVLLINMIESNILTPVIMNKNLWINTIVIFVSMILWGLLMWVLWILLAVPIAAIITLMFEKELD